MRIFTRLVCLACAVAWLMPTAQAVTLHLDSADTIGNWAFDTSSWNVITDATAPSADDQVLSGLTAGGFTHLVSLVATFGRNDAATPAPGYPVEATFVFKITAAPSSWATLRMGFREETDKYYTVDFPMHAPGVLNVVEDNNTVLTPSAVDISAAGLAPGDWAKLTLTINGDETIQGSITRWNGSAYGTAVPFGPFTPQTPTNGLGGANLWRTYFSQFSDAGVAIEHRMDSIELTAAAVPVELSAFDLQ